MIYMIIVLSILAGIFLGIILEDILDSIDVNRSKKLFIKYSISVLLIVLGLITMLVA